MVSLLLAERADTCFVRKAASMYLNLVQTLLATRELGLEAFVYHSCMFSDFK